MIDDVTFSRIGVGGLFATVVVGCTIEDQSGDGSGAGGSSAGGASSSSGGASPGTQIASGGQAQGQGGTAPGSGGAGGSDGSGGTAPGGSGGVDGAGGSSAAGGVRTDGGSAAGGTGDGGNPEPACEGGKVVHFVYFVESDQPYSEAQRADVERQAFVFQRYWFEQLGVTFYVNDPPVDVIRGDQTAQWYVSTPDGIHQDPRWYRLGNIKNEVYRKLEIGNFDPDHRVVSYPTTRHDGRVGANFGGAWMDGDDLTCLSDGGFNYPYPDGSSAHCTGHVAHEFGHVLGLGHQGPNDDCMQFGFYTNDPGDLCSFSAANVAQILAEPDNEGWFEAAPGQICRGR